MNKDCSKDWKKIAHASGLGVPDEALERIAQSLDALETDFRPLVASLTPDAEPATVFRPAPPTDEEDAG
ncbi:MAG TPA: hypothetical protein VMG35_08280 [Bryobacteraceae bacterium]|nr:hypothetical protein [Bryobacteraceae bacterium]